MYPEGYITWWYSSGPDWAEETCIDVSSSPSCCRSLPTMWYSWHLLLQQTWLWVHGERCDIGDRALLLRFSLRLWQCLRNGTPKK